MDYKKLWADYLKEPTRWIAIAFVAYLTDMVVPQMKPEHIPYLMIALRGIDKWLHDLGKIIESERLTKGLVGF